MQRTQEEVAGGQALVVWIVNCHCDNVANCQIQFSMGETKIQGASAFFTLRFEIGNNLNNW